MRSKQPSWAIVSAAVIFGVLDGHAPAATKLRAPVAIEDVLNTRNLESRGGITFSPDSAWATQVYQTARGTYLEGGSVGHSASGVPVSSGSGTRRLRLIRIVDGSAFDLGAGEVSTWSPSWSPDATRLAYYSDDGGEAGLWIWTVATQTSKRIGKVIVRPNFWHEVPRWIDNQRIIAKILPEGMSVTEANRLTPDGVDGRQLPPGPKGGQSSVLALSSTAKDTKSAASKVAVRTTAWANVELGDVALIDVESGAAARLSHRTTLRGLAPSPDGRWVTYAKVKGLIENTQQPIYDFHLIDLQKRADRVLLPLVRMGYGNEVSWSPDSRSLAMTLYDDALTPKEVIVADLEGKVVRFDIAVTAPDVTKFALYQVGLTGAAPLWSADGKFVFAIHTGQLWRLDPARRQAKQVTNLTSSRLQRLATVDGSGTTHAPRPGSLTAFAQDRATNESQVVEVDLATGEFNAVFRAGKKNMSAENAAVAPSGAIATAMSDAASLVDLWLINARNGTARELSQLNPQLDQYQLGETRLIRWTSMSGNLRKGILMLPPGFKPGSRPPLLAFVYGSEDNVERLINRYVFGWGERPMFNLHILTTRGYAVFYPELPLTVGESIESFMDSLMPGIDLLVKEGYADPNRMAIFGQSFGAYTVWSVIGQTTRFKAAITTANVLHPDLIAEYLQLGPEGTPFSTGYLEKGQGNMGGTPWTHRERYIKNSPVTYLDRIQTPLLMGQGSLDGLVSSDAMFVGLTRLGKPVEYRIYPGEGHAIQFRGNVRDFWQRRLEFLDEHLGTSAAMASAKKPAAE